MTPRIEILLEKKLIGKSLKMSVSNDRTYELWHSFMPHRKEIKNNLSTDLFNVKVFDLSYDFQHFDPGAEYEKWAAMEVSDFKTIPENMEAFILKGGLYAVFIHKGSADTGPQTFGYIFGTWLPNSEYEMDSRPHFDLLGEKYKKDDPDSEEEIWVPIKPKKAVLV
jgi:AraC family transcriptional regulator